MRNIIFTYKKKYVYIKNINICIKNKKIQILIYILRYIFLDLFYRGQLVVMQFTTSNIVF